MSSQSELHRYRGEAMKLNDKNMYSKNKVQLHYTSLYGEYARSLLIAGDIIEAP